LNYPIWPATGKSPTTNQNNLTASSEVSGKLSELRFDECEHAASANLLREDASQSRRKAEEKARGNGKGKSLIKVR
jgi:hypothetical protein